MRRLVLLLLLAGCATPSRTPPPPGPGEVPSVQAARDALAIGRSTKADVRAALGPGTEVPFDDGHEVWVYRQQLKEKEKPPRRELVLLFDRAGILAKTRVR